MPKKFTVQCSKEQLAALADRPGAHLSLIDADNVNVGSFIDPGGSGAIIGFVRNPDTNFITFTIAQNPGNMDVDGIQRTIEADLVNTGIQITRIDLLKENQSTEQKTVDSGNSHQTVLAPKP